MVVQNQSHLTRVITTLATKSKLSDKEKTRLAALRKLQILDSPFETVFDTITQIASDVCGTPIALISMVDEKRQWFKSNVGLEGVTETPRDIAFCSSTILTNETLEISDATQDDRFSSNPLVTGAPFIRFYAASPITLPMGENIGTICVIDNKANQLNEFQKKTLEGLAKLVAQLLVARQVNQTHLNIENLIDE